MADLLTTKEILGALESIIKNAEKYICIFTFNIKIDPNYLTRLKNAAKRGVKITIVFGVENGDYELLDDLINIENCTVYFKQYLHAKFYYNEKELLVGSMNLSEASAKNNFELAVYFKGDEYKSTIPKVKKEAKEIIDDAKLWNNPHGPDDFVDFDEDNLEEEFLKRPTVGRCVRCKQELEYNLAKPLCRDCYQQWSDWENEYYPENYCHSCGIKHDDISYAKPECYNCYQFNGLLPHN